MMFINTAQAGVYQTKGVVATVNHRIPEAQLRTIIQLAAEEFGADFVYQALGDSKEHDHGYMVSIDGAGAPSKVHRTAGDAEEEEAKRILSGSSAPKTARILKVLKLLRSKTTVTIEEDE